MIMTKKARLDGGLVFSKALGMFVCNRGGGSCRPTPACADCYVWRSCRAYANTARAWTPGGTDDQNYARLTAEVFSGLPFVRLASRGEFLANRSDVDRVVSWVKANPSTLFWVPTRAIFKNKGKELDRKHMEYIEYHLASRMNARVLASLDPFTAHLWEALEKRRWSTMFYESATVPRGYEHTGSHPALGKPGAKLHLCAKTWDLYLADTGRIVGPKGKCAMCSEGCFSLTRVDVWLRNHARSPKMSALQDKARAQNLIDSAS